VKLSRRDFLRLSGATAGGAVALSTPPTGVAAAKASDKQFHLHKKIREEESNGR
jgi:anaerobic selenocysteine-containing dehydrogenase